MDLRSLLFSFEGRINRAKYWLAGLIYLIGAMLYLTTSIYALAGSLRDTDPARVVSLFPILLYAITYPLFAIGMWSCAAPRSSGCATATRAAGGLSHSSFFRC
jgi:uncharacterized membrane protein YhaH (DUF805 family)